MGEAAGSIPAQSIRFYKLPLRYQDSF